MKSNRVRVRSESPVVSRNVATASEDSPKSGRPDRIIPDGCVFSSRDTQAYNHLNDNFRNLDEVNNFVTQSTLRSDDSYTLDDYDIALLAEPILDRQREASQGLNRLSLRPKDLSVYSPRSYRDDVPLSAAEMEFREQNKDPRTPARHVSENHRAVSSGLFITPSHNSAHFSSSPVISSPSPSFQDIGRRFSVGTGESSASGRILQPCASYRFPRAIKQVTQSMQASSDDMLPWVQNIQLVSTNDIPDRLRSIFSFQVFNAVQSKCFKTVYGSIDNFVLSAPTGSGKTVVFELAICHLLVRNQADHYKIVYVAPTKSLCSERYKDWKLKFRHLNLECLELTGDSDSAQLSNVQTANVIITTPEKWDSLTRRWKDHEKLMRLVKLFLIDEVHILKDMRGATLEAVTARMMTVGNNVRFLALSATIPNSKDVAAWLGLNSGERGVSAHYEVFGEEFRPVKLKKYVEGIPWRGSDFGFDGACDQRLPELIVKYAAGKPILIFCSTRKSTLATAKALAIAWNKPGPLRQQWSNPKHPLGLSDPELRNIALSGIAIHHAGLDLHDRCMIEQGYRKGDINVICCTSTLAVGVNLPCHLVIIKNTVVWQQGELKEYTDLELMQMLGRAGRPQFDSSAVAVIITKQEKVGQYGRLVTGQDILESCLHLNLIEHLNAEINLGTIKDLETAKTWLSGTFLYIRLQKNPDYYKLDSSATVGDVGQMIQSICSRNIALLHERNLVCGSSYLKSTPFGDAMARYCVKYESMKAFLSLPRGAKVFDILSSIAEAEEFHEVRFRNGEKSLYKLLNKSTSMRFPFTGNLTLASHKRSILIQCELGSVDFPMDHQFSKHRTQFVQDRSIIFANVHRLVRCIIDCQIHCEDARGLRNALEVGRSLGAKAWDTSPLQMKQLPGIGPVAVRKFALAGIGNIDALEATEALRINSILGKHPGFGETLHHKLREFPKVRISLRSMGCITRKGQLPVIKFSADIGFMNHKTPQFFNKKVIYVCFLAERSDGLLIDFRRITSRNVGKNEIRLSTPLSDEGQKIICSVMCDDIAGTFRSAEVAHDIPKSAFQADQPQHTSPVQLASSVNCFKPLVVDNDKLSHSLKRTFDEVSYQDGEVDDRDLLAAADDVEFQDIDDIERQLSKPICRPTKATKVTEKSDAGKGELKLENGNWPCNHKCKDKATCKHLCCREGLEHPPKRPRSGCNDKSDTANSQGNLATRLSIPKTPFKLPRPIALYSPRPILDITSKYQHPDNGRNQSEKSREIEQFQSPILPQRRRVSITPALAVSSEEAGPPSPIYKRPKLGRRISIDGFESQWMNDLLPRGFEEPVLKAKADEQQGTARYNRRPLIPLNEYDIDRDLEDYDEPVTISSFAKWSDITEDLEADDSQEQPTHQITDSGASGVGGDLSSHVIRSGDQIVDSRSLETPSRTYNTSPFFGKSIEERKTKALREPLSTLTPNPKVRDNCPGETGSGPLDSSHDLSNQSKHSTTLTSSENHYQHNEFNPAIKAEFENLFGVID